MDVVVGTANHCETLDYICHVCPLALVLLRRLEDLASLRLYLILSHLGIAFEKLALLLLYVLVFNLMAVFAI